MPVALKMPERFWSKVDRADVGCWEWLASPHSTGYGQFRLDGRTRKAQQVAYELEVGPVPEGMTLDHLCSVPLCVKPDHLEPVTPAENTRRGRSGQAAKTHCPHGHPYDPENTIIAKSGQRVCRKCLLARGDRVRKRARERRRLGVIVGKAHVCQQCQRPFAANGNANKFCSPGCYHSSMRETRPDA